MGIMLCCALGLLGALIGLTTLRVQAEVAEISAALTLEVDRSDDSAIAKQCTAAANDCSLRGAVIKANSNAGSTIVLKRVVYELSIAKTGADDAASGDLNLTKDMTITVAPCAQICFTNAVVQGGNGWQSGIFVLEPSADVIMKGFIIRNGHANSGGGIAAEGDLTLVGMAVKENLADVRGGGVWGYGSNIVITNTLIMSNTANNGGGIRIEGGSKLLAYGLNLVGNQATQSGGGLYSIDESQIANSSIFNNRSSENGGGIYVGENSLALRFSEVVSNSAVNGGGIWNAGDVTLSSGVVEDNRATDGGGIYNAVRSNLAVIWDSRISDNHATHEGGGIYNQAHGAAPNAKEGHASISESLLLDNSADIGGGVSNNGVMTVTQSRLQGNQAFSGGGVLNNSGGVLAISATDLLSNTVGDGGGGALYNYNGQVQMTASFLAHNQSSNIGGAIFNSDRLIANQLVLVDNRAKLGGGIGNSALATVTNSSLLGNSALDGGGLWAYGNRAVVLNSTIANNQAYNNGGGLFVNASSVLLNHVTLSGNTADADTDGGNGGGLFNVDGQVRASNTLLGGNLDLSGQTPDCAGAVESYGYNLISQVNGCAISGVTNGNITGVAALLGTLQANGGDPVGLSNQPMLTMLPLKSSPAVNAASPVVSDDDSACNTPDQLAVSRPIGLRCDIGAVESSFLGQSISFAPLADKLSVDPPFALTASASSGYAVSFAASGVCSVNGNQVLLSGAAGYCQITASQPGDDVLYLPAEPIAHSFAVNDPNKQNQTITFAELPNKKLNDAAFLVSAAASSGLPVSITSDAPTICSVNPDNIVLLLALGECTLRASQTGNNTFNPATSVVRSFIIGDPARQDQSIIFEQPADQLLSSGSTGLAVSATSGLPVVLQSLTPSVCSLDAMTATLIAVGDCTIRAMQPGNSSFNPALAIQRSFKVETEAQGGGQKVYLPIVVR